jgi:phosphoribosylglycinamide formyltransferase-1
MIRIAVFASGSGTNAEKLVKHFVNSDIATVELILTNNKEAGVINRAQGLNVKCEVFSNNQFKKGGDILQTVSKNKIDFIVLAGFLLLIPGNIIREYKNRIVNIHPALLPLYGGKGFYGRKVHEAVIQSGAIISGITIHKVNENFDEGEIIFQAACHVNKEDTPSTLAEKIHSLEYTFFSSVVEKVISLLPK